MNSQNGGVRAELAAARKPEKSKPLGSQGLSWVFIVILLVLMAVSVTIFRQPVSEDLPGNIGETAKPTPEREPRVYTVSYRNGVFSPTNLRIHAGDTVRFRNDSLFGIRIISNDLSGFDSVGPVPQGSTFSFTFATTGIFGYHNEGEPDESGTIIVR